MTTSTVERTLYGYRFVETQHGDTLQRVAARELGDAARWPEIVAYNDLVPPFITDDATEAGNGVILTGQPLRVPASSVIVDAATNPDATFLVDASLVNGLLADDGSGDFAVVAGLGNLRQALRHRLQTDRGELIFHPQYGSLLRRLIGAVSGPTATLLAAQYARAAVESDERIDRVTSSTAEASGDQITVNVEAEAIAGRQISLSESV